MAGKRKDPKVPPATMAVPRDPNAPPKPRGARDFAREVLGRIERDQAYATPALSAALTKSKLSPADVGLATELVYGVLRNRSRIDRTLAAYIPRGLPGDVPVLDTLRVAAHQLLFLTRVPAHAAVDEAVNGIKILRGTSVAGFVNAVLRKVASQGEPKIEGTLAERLSIEHSMPAWIVAAVHGALSEPSELADAVRSLNEAPAVALRATGRAPRAEVMAALAAERPDAELVASPFLEESFLARGLASPFDTAAAKAGQYVAEDLGAQAVARLLAPAAGMRILDACAGRGGKSLHLADLAGGGAEIHAVDVSPRKLEVLAQAAALTGAKTIRTSVCDLTSASAVAATLAPSYDAVLIDAPCSGLGVLRRHPEAKWRREAHDPIRLAELAAKIVDTTAPLVAPGGLLVFAVCTFTRDETDVQLARILARHPELTPEPPPATPGVDWPALTEGSHILRTWPHRHQADAFFAVRLRRRA